MKTLMALTIASWFALAGCREGSRDERPGPARSVDTPAKTVDTPPTVGGGSVIPGSDSIRSLLGNAGRKAAPSGSTVSGVGGLFGKSGPLALPVGGAGPVPGAPAAVPTSEGGEPPAAPPAPPVTLPPPASAGGDCAAVARRVGAIARAQIDAQLAGLDEETRRATAEMVEGMVAELPAQVQAACEQQAWPQELRDCVLTASDVDALQGCERFATPEMRKAAEAAANDTSSSPAPAPQGPPPRWDGASSDCAAVGAHVVALARWQISGAPEAQRGMAEEMLPTIGDQVAGACDMGSWSEDARRCMLEAQSLEAVDACAAKLGR
jgi:hypothetical protein